MNGVKTGKTELSCSRSKQIQVKMKKILRLYAPFRIICKNKALSTS